MRVVVIGGGVIGFSAAHELARRGADVTVLDMRGPGLGATQASAGMLAPYIEGHSDELLRLGEYSLSLYDAFVARLESGSARRVEYRRDGTLQVAYRALHAEALASDAVRLERRGVPHQLVTEAEARVLEAGVASGVRCALLIPSHGYVHVPNLMDALVGASARLGICVRVDRVLEIQPRGTGLRVCGERDAFDADVVVLAGGSWTGSLIPDAGVCLVKPIRGQSLEVVGAEPLLGRVVWGEDCYLVPREDGSLIVGATVEDVGFDESSTTDARERLLEAARRVVPALPSNADVQVRVGLRPHTPDELPLVGWSSTMPGVYLATGHYRNGILLAPLTATLVADAVLDRESPDLRWARDMVTPSRVEAQS